MCRLAASLGRSSGKDGTLQRQPIDKSCKNNVLRFIWQALTSFRLKVGDTVHDNVVQEERFVVDFDVSRQKAIEVTHIPAVKFPILISFNLNITGVS